MYLMGHIASSLLIAIIIEKIFELEINKLYIGFASMFPDMIDKSIGSFIFNNGRWFGHSLLFLVSILIILLILNKVLSETNKDKLQLNTQNAYTFFIGTIIHLIGDWINKEVVFWPLFGDFPPGSLNAFLFGFQDTFTTVTEIIGTITIILIGYSENWGRNTWIKYILLYVSYITSFTVLYYLLVINV